MNCILYARVSTDKQAEKDLSIPAQLRLMREYAQQQGWTVVEEFVEPGESATSANRPVLQSILTRIREGTLTVDVMVAHKLNRMSRNIEDYVPMRMALRKRGVRLSYVVERIDDSAQGQFLENIMASMAQFESANLSDETKKGMRQKVLSGGWPHRPPRGYVVVKTPDRPGSHVEIHPREGALIRRAFELFGSGVYSIQAVAARLARDGLVSRSGGPIPKSHLHRLLTNEFYIGRLRWKDLNVEGQHPVLVPPSVFEKVQKVIADRYRNPARKGTARGLPLRGIAICATCRGRMTGEWHDRWGYYRCGRQSYRRELCDARMCNAKRAHTDLLRLCRQLQLSRAAADTLQSVADEILEQRKVAGVATGGAERDGERSDLILAETQLTEAFTAGDLAPPTYRVRVEELQQRKTRLESMARRAQVDPEETSASVRRTLDLATSLGDLYERFDDGQRAEFLRHVFTSIVLSPNGIVSHSLNPTLASLLGAGHSATSKPDDRRRVVEALLDNALAV